MPSKLGDTVGHTKPAMASIFLRSAPKKATEGNPKRKPVWWAQFYVPDPKRINPETGRPMLRQVRKSTGQTSKKKAEAAAYEMERTAQQVIRSGTDKAIQAKAILAKAVADIEREAFTPLAARKYLAELLQIATGDELTEFTVETWIAEWLRRKARNSSPATMRRYTAHTKAFTDWIGEPAKGKPLESVTTSTVRAWRESLQDEGRAGKTVLAYMKDLGAVYRAAIREGLTHFNPVTAIEQISTDDSQSRKPFTYREVAQLVKAAPSQEWAGLILVAAYTGLRLGDAARLSWESVDLQEKRITVIPSKTKRKKREVRIPIQPDLLAYFEGIPVHDDSPAAPVFPTLAKSPIHTRVGLSAQFVDIMTAASVDRGKPSRVIKDGETKGKGRITWERGFHSLRHTFTTWLRSAGVSEEDRMALTGHSTRESHALYSHQDEKALREAVDKLQSLSES